MPCRMQNRSFLGENGGSGPSDAQKRVGDAQELISHSGTEFHVARSLRDREWGIDRRRTVGFLSISPHPHSKRPECESRRDSPTWPRLSETRKARYASPNLGNSAGFGRVMENSRRDSQPRGMEQSECESRRDSPTWPRLSETRKARYASPNLGNSVGFGRVMENSRRDSQPRGMERSECESRRDSPTWPRLSETRKARYASPNLGNSVGFGCVMENSRRDSQPRGMEQSECESRRDSPT